MSCWLVVLFVRERVHNHALLKTIVYLASSYAGYFRNEAWTVCLEDLIRLESI